MKFSFDWAKSYERLKDRKDILEKIAEIKRQFKENIIEQNEQWEIRMPQELEESLKHTEQMNFYLW